MKDYEYTYDVLTKVVVDELPFNVAIRSVLNQPNKKIMDPNLKAMLYSTTGCVLRHYYVFKEIISRQYSNLSEEQFLLIAMGIGNKLFAKRFDENKLGQYIAKKTGLQGAPAFIQCFQDPKKLIPDDIEYGSQNYYSLRYNIPVWVIDIWQKNGGEIISKKLFHCATNRLDNLVRINESIITSEDFFDKYPDFKPLGDKIGIAQYKDDSVSKKHKAIFSGDAVRIPVSYKRMCDDLNIKDLDNIAIYGSGTNHLLEELCVRLGPNFKADYICGHSGHKLEIADNISKYGLTDVALHEGDINDLAKIISGPVKTLFVCPRSTFFLGLYERADHFLRVSKEDLAVHLEEERKIIAAADRFVQAGGNLVYFVTTCCTKECHSLIRDFLKEHHNYELVEEKQFFPFDKYQTLLYFAIMKKS